MYFLGDAMEKKKRDERMCISRDVMMILLIFFPRAFADLLLPYGGLLERKSTCFPQAQSINALIF